MSGYFGRLLWIQLCLVAVAPALAFSPMSSSSSAWKHNNNNIPPDETSISMSDFASRLQRIEEGTAAPSLLSFYEPDLQSFSVQPGASRLSVTSTCFALQAMLATEKPALYEGQIALDPRLFLVASADGDSPNDEAEEASPMESSSTQTQSSTQSSSQSSSTQRTPVQAILQALVQSDWRPDDLFQVPVLLYTVLKVDTPRRLAGSEPIQRLVQAVLKARARRRNGLEHQIYSDYILFQCTQVYAELSESSRQRAVDHHQHGPEIAPLADPAQVSLALARSAEIGYHTLCRELALRAAGAEFDVMRLAYSLLTYVVATHQLVLLQGPSATTNDHNVDDNNDNHNNDPTTTVQPVNRKLVQAGLAAFFAAQNPADGSWPAKGQPIYRSFRKTGRNIGNAFIYVADTVASLLEHLPAADFRPHLRNLEQFLDWIEDHHRTLPGLQGWSSPHLSRDARPLAWSTAQTAACLSRMRTVVETLGHEDVLWEFRGSIATRANPAAWDRLLDADLGDCGRDGTTTLTLKQVLDERMIQPRLSDDNVVVVEAYSAILFGPPGTAKTTIAQALAERLGYDFLVIDTSEFLADGLTSVASRIRYVFSRLQALRRSVILFDECDEFCLDRSSPGIGMESRMLTTALLTAINDLRRTKKSIFFFATNRLRAFDAAITRPGRFDLQLFVGTPNRAARSIQFQQQLLANHVGVVATTDQQQQQQEALEAYERFLAGVWEEDAQYMNYMEGVKFAQACANVVAQQRPLTDEIMGEIFQSQKAVMTARGAVREEFDASKGMTRL